MEGLEFSDWKEIKAEKYSDGWEYTLVRGFTDPRQKDS